MSKNKKGKLNLLISNNKNRQLLQELLSDDFEISNDSILDCDEVDVDIIILDRKFFEEYKADLDLIKQNNHSFTPVILMEKNNTGLSEISFQTVEDVIELPISKDILLRRIDNLLYSKKLWDEHEALKDRYVSIFDNINDMVFLLDISDKEDLQIEISETNEKLLEKLDCEEKDIKNSSPEKFMAGEDIKELVGIVGERGEALFTTEFYNGAGEMIPVEINASEVQIHQREQILCAARDITEKKQKEEKLNYTLFHDDLTGLYNRRFFEEEIKRLDTKRQLPLSIFIIDINGLKLINDSYGHEAGDKLLIKTANLLQKAFREEDILARWGGDEFSVLLPQTSASEAEKIQKRLKEKCDKTEEDRLPVSLGMGFSVKKDKDQDIYNVLKSADDEMYDDKLISRKSATSKIVSGLLSALESTSFETKNHKMRLTSMSIELGEKIGLSNKQLNNLSLLASLHDVGKVNISEDILTKSEKLNEDEWERIKKHPRIGYKIAFSSGDFSSVADEILAHHEHWNGEGYPRGLEKEEIPLLSRILSIVDAYDVMISGRPYKIEMNEEGALDELKRCAGSQFDPRLVEEFVEMVENE